ncbi:MAG: serine protease [Gammaproteobacteria bacterium]|nr:serine protease [Gammaproteobacteria bacterium]
MQEFELQGVYKDIAAVQEAQQDALLSQANVEGVGIGHKISQGVDTGEPCVSVFVSQKLSPALLGPDESIVPTLGKFKTDVVETGIIFAGEAVAKARKKTKKPAPRKVARPPTPLPTDWAVTPGAPDYVELEADFLEEEIGIETLKTRVRPAEGGYSVGHYRITAGTIATSVFDRAPYPGIPQKYYILSNNHVLANSNLARIGDPILQPGRVDGGRYPADMIGRLSRFVPIQFGGPLNYVDAAVAEGDFHDLNREIFWIGYVKGVRFLTRVGDIVQKTGRTTNYTTGRVTNINATVNVNYGGGRVARMARQIVTTPMSAGGDSGSLLCDMDGNAVGLLFAGSSRVTIHNHIMYVQNLLGIRVA